jgi:hypothetical protein
MGDMAGRPPERDELDALLDPLLNLAQELLKKRGEFFPFGGTIGDQGQVSLTAADTGIERPPSQDVIDLLARGMRSQAQAGRIRASGICYDTRFAPDGGQLTDAIAVSLEHAAGDAALVLLPYGKGRFTGLKFGSLIALPPDERQLGRCSPSGRLRRSSYTRPTVKGAA